MPARPTPNFFSAARRLTDWAICFVSSSNWLFIIFLSLVVQLFQSSHPIHLQLAGFDPRNNIVEEAERFERVHTVGNAKSSISQIAARRCRYECRRPLHGIDPE